jgi:hypothetical protein
MESPPRFPRGSIVKATMEGATVDSKVSNQRCVFQLVAVWPCAGSRPVLSGPIDKGFPGSSFAGFSLAASPTPKVTKRIIDKAALGLMA